MKRSVIKERMKIYLDIDGVLLDHNYEQMSHLREFVKAVFDVAGDEVYWLSTHTKHGESDVALYHLEDLDRDILDMLKRVKNTKWDTLKTEGIDLDSEFIWFDDNVFNAEYRVLEKVNKEYCLIKVENNLEEIVDLLKEED